MGDKTIFEIFWEDPAKAHAVYVDTENGFMVIPDSRPVTANHLMVIPKEPIASVDDLPDVRYHQLWELVRITRKHIADTVTPERGVGTAIWGRVVPHVHVHVFARTTKGDGQLFFGERSEATPAELEALRKRLAFPPALFDQTVARLREVGNRYRNT